MFGKRDAFRRAFDDAFDIARVATMSERDIDRLVQDSSIIRDRAKIQATLENARTMMTLHYAPPNAGDPTRATARAPRVQLQTSPHRRRRRRRSPSS